MEKASLGLTGGCDLAFPDLSSLHSDSVATRPSPYHVSGSITIVPLFLLGKSEAASAHGTGCPGLCPQSCSQPQAVPGGRQTAQVPSLGLDSPSLTPPVCHCRLPPGASAYATFTRSWARPPPARPLSPPLHQPPPGSLACVHPSPTSPAETTGSTKSWQKSGIEIMNLF